MLSKYSRLLVENKYLEKQKENILTELKNKKILIYGCGSAFLELDKIYDYTSNLNIVAISDKKFETEPKDYKDIKAVAPKDICNYNFDKVLITNENAYPIRQYLINSHSISENKIISIYPDDIKDAPAICTYIESFGFNRQLKKLGKKLKNKSIIIYGTGEFFRTIYKHYNLSELNIIALCDQKFENHNIDEIYLGYKVCSPNEIRSLNPDYVLVGTKFYMSIIDEIYEQYLAGTRIKIRALIKKPILTLLKEIWGK